MGTFGASRTELSATMMPGMPSEKQLAYAIALARELKQGIPYEAISDKQHCSSFIDAMLQRKQGSKLDIVSPAAVGDGVPSAAPFVSAVADSAADLFQDPFMAQEVVQPAPSTATSSSSFEDDSIPF